VRLIGILAITKRSVYTVAAVNYVFQECELQLNVLVAAEFFQFVLI